MNHNKRKGWDECMISYAPLWRTMERKGITKYALINTYHFDAHTLSSLRQNKSITAHTLETLCKILECSPNDVIEFIE